MAYNKKMGIRAGRLEVKDVEPITRRAPVLPEVRRGGKIVDPESLLRHEESTRRAPYRSSPSKYSSSIRLTAYRIRVRTPISCTTMRRASSSPSIRTMRFGLLAT